MSSPFRSPRQSAGRAALLGAAAALASCSSLPSQRAEAPALPAAWEDGTTAADTSSLTQWWKGFNDPTLDALIDEGLTDAPTARLALLRLKQAIAVNHQTLADFLPQVSGFAQGSYTRVEDGPDLVGSFQSFVTSGGASRIVREKEQFTGTYGPQVTWQIPLFGRLQAAAVGAKAQYKVSKEDLRGVRATLTADIAQAYVDFRAGQQTVAALKESAGFAERLAAITQISADAGISAPADAADARRLAEATKARVPDAVLSARRAAATLATLRGHAPGTEKESVRAALEATPGIPVYPLDTAPAAPADLLRLRPDIAQAEAQTIVAAARVGIAREDLLPQIQVKGSLNISDNIIGSGLSEQLAQISATPSLSVPLFGWGERLAAVRAQKAQFEQALVTYQNTVNKAVSEASIALAGLRLGETRLAAAKAAEAAAEITARGVRASNEAGIASVADRLRAEQQLLDARITRISAAQTQASAAIQVYRAFGGGPPELTGKALKDQLRGASK